MNAASLVAIRNVSKTYGGVRALTGVSFAIAPGEVHALCGENGAGKSTLNKILSGSCVPDDVGRDASEPSEVLVGGEALRLGDVAASEAAGIAIIHQESTAFLHLDAEDNIFVGREPKRFGGLVLDRRAMRTQTRALLERLGESFDQRRPLSDLTVAQRQMVGIARALSRECRLLIMDEPTASLSGRETDVLFQIIRQLRADGVSILYVSHRLEEVFELADRVTVLRDGGYVGTRPVAEVTKDELIRMMVGREVEELAGKPPHAAEPGETQPEVRGLTLEGVFRDVSFSVRAGEIVGLAGLVGAGRSEVARAVFGIDRPDGGAVLVGGRAPVPGSVQSAIASGVSYVPEDRQRQGLALPMSVGENLTLPVLRTLTRGGLLARGLERRLVERTMTDLTVRAASPRMPVESLSGGNQQKVLLGKWLASEPKVLILDEPTRGIDVAAKAEVHRLVRDLARRGVAILMISSELPEVLSMSDRILVMREGTIAGELSREAATQEGVLELALPEESGGEAAPEESGQDEGEDEGVATRAKRLLLHMARKREYGVLALMVLTFLAVTLVNPDFLKLENIRDLLIRCAPVAIVACGVTLVIVTREIDISVGSLMGLLAAVVGILTCPNLKGLPVPLGVAITLCVGAGVGLVTGLLVAIGRVPSIIVTLGMLTALRGVTELLMGGEWITDLPHGLRFLGTGTLLNVRICIWTAAVVVVFTALLARYTPLGRRIYAVGCSPRSAVLAGISPTRIRLFVFTYTGLLTAVAMLVHVPDLTTIESGIGVGFELLVVTCVVVGGTSISGGRGLVVGSLFGVLLLGAVGTVLIFLKLGEMSTYWERAIQGAFILMAVLVDHLARRRSESGEEA